MPTEKARLLERNGMAVVLEVLGEDHMVVVVVVVHGGLEVGLTMFVDWTVFEGLTIILYLPVVPAAAERGLCGSA
uniref:Uncharacterized protein n=1 Tax=Cannabis sativa TaxID=3483 RepID=A0A803QUK0_CANSA